MYSSETKICQSCKNPFTIEPEDFAFYEKMQVPAPTLCFSCRSRQRTAFLPYLLKFYKKECAAHPGESVISCLHPQSPYRIYCNPYYFSPDAWDACSYGREFDFTRPFFDQFRELLLAVPHFAIPRYEHQIVNSDYSVGSFDVKNCYLSTIIGLSENVDYSVWCVRSRDCMDCLAIGQCEDSYELVNSGECFGSKYLQNCNQCVSCAFLYDCKNCQNCFMCANLRNKQYYFRNRPLSKDEYKNQMEKMRLGDIRVLRECLREFSELRGGALHKYAWNLQTKNVTGDQAGESKDCREAFWLNSCENVHHSSDVIQTKDSMDLSVAGPGERCYYTAEMLNCYNVKFCYFVSESSDLEYCFECFDCKDCFGCVGLKKKQFCVFNRQYAESEYRALVLRVREHMKRGGEYGEFLSPEWALYCYDDTLASIVHPASKEEKDRMRLVSLSEEPGGSYANALAAKDLPADIREVGDDILERVVLCEVSGKPFRIMPQELAFLRKHGLPLPRKHPQARLRERLALRNPMRLWQRKCGCPAPGHPMTAPHTHGEERCENVFETPYAPDRPEIVYCENCYNQEVV